MKQPTIISISCPTPSNVTLALFIPRELDYFTGHFPATPVLAGVVQTDWVMQFSTQHFKGIDKNDFSSIDQLKFSGPILPDTHASLDLSLHTHVIQFKYYHEQHVFSSGKIRLAGH